MLSVRVTQTHIKEDKDMKGYNKERTQKTAERKTKAKVLSVWNGKAWTRVSSKSLEFYGKELAIVSSKEINEHRIEYFNADGRCVMIYEF